MQRGMDAGEVYKVKPTEPDDGLEGGGREADAEPHVHFCLE